MKESNESFKKDSESLLNKTEKTPENETLENIESKRGYIRVYIKEKLSKSSNIAVDGGIGIASLFIWLMKKGSEKIKEYAISELKGAFKKFKIPE